MTQDAVTTSAGFSLQPSPRPREKQKGWWRPCVEGELSPRAAGYRPPAPQGEGRRPGWGHSPRLGLGKLSCSRKTTFSTKCWISHCSGPRTNTIQSCVKPSVVGFLRSWARCPSSNLTWTVHCREREAGTGSTQSPGQGAAGCALPLAPCGLQSS